MISACEHELRPACYGAEPPNFQFVAVDGIVIEYVVLFKVTGIVDEIVVDRVVANFNVRV